MEIKHYSKEELFTRLRQVRLKGHGQPKIYEHAHLALVQVDPRDLVPAQRYVMKDNVQRIKMIAATSHTAISLCDGKPLDFSAAMFNLKGFITINGQPWIPPIVEVSITKDDWSGLRSGNTITGRQVLLINDGMHRVKAAMDLCLPVTVVLASNLLPEYPYYAWPLENGWADVEVVETRPEIKKDYRETDYKALFRDFNAQFPGVQPERK